MNWKKNILFLMTDQHRADHVGWAPNSKLAMPNLDRLAEGTAFLNCLSSNPICTPARTALLTGKYTHQIGTLSMSGDLSPQHPTYPRALQQAGYYTAGVGKFHWFQGWPWGTARGKGHHLSAMEDELKSFGFDTVWEAAGKQLALHNHCHYCDHLQNKGILDQFRDHVSSRGKNWSEAAKVNFTGEPWPFNERDYVDIVTCDKIIEAIKQRPRDKPLFLFGSFCSPHAPFDPPQRYLDMVDREEVDDFVVTDEPIPDEAKKLLYKLRRSYKAMLLCVDEQIGRILAALEDEDLLSDTVILFTTDHGEMMGDHGLIQKAQPWWQACTVPTVIRHPDHLLSRRITAPVELTDLTATILDIAELDIKESLSRLWPAFQDRVPCKSLLPIINGSADSIRDYAFSECSGQWQMIQSNQWKYIHYLSRNDPDSLDDHLYDLSKDPDCTNDLASCSEHGDVLELQRKRLTFVLDQTPTAQLRWAPSGENETPFIRPSDTFSQP